MAAGSGQGSLSRLQLGLQCQRWPEREEFDWKPDSGERRTSLFPPTPLFASRILRPTLLEIDGCCTASFNWIGLDLVSLGGREIQYCAEYSSHEKVRGRKVMWHKSCKFRVSLNTIQLFVLSDLKYQRLGKGLNWWLTRKHPSWVARGEEWRFIKSLFRADSFLCLVA